ncbi:MAG: hypothetical protein ACRD8O_11385 [Bryobacteraceae bacterium]
MAESIRYRQLPGVRRTPISRASLWLGDDHLLLVRSNRFVEEYKRYYLNDIQAIVIRQSNDVAGSKIALNVTIGAAMLAIAIFGGPFVRVAAGILFVMFVLLKLRGPMCACHLITAVSQDRLPSLYRLRNAQRAARIIRQAVEPVQGPQQPPATAPPAEHVEPIPTQQE